MHKYTVVLFSPDATANQSKKTKKKKNRTVSEAAEHLLNGTFYLYTDDKDEATTTKKRGLSGGCPPTHTLTHKHRYATYCSLAPTYIKTLRHIEAQ